MRRTRVDESSKTVRAAVRSKVQSVPRGETGESKKKALERKAPGDKASKTAGATFSSIAKAASDATKPNGSGEPDRQTGAATKSQSKAPAASRSSRDTKRKDSKPATENETNGAKLRHERKAGSEKRGVSTIYMPKTSTVGSSKTSGSGESRKGPATSYTRAKDAKVAATRDKDAKVSTTRAKDAKVAATRDKDAKVAATRDKDAKVAATRDKDAKVAATRTKDDAKISSVRTRIDDPEATSTGTKNWDDSGTNGGGNKEANVKSKDRYTRQRLPSRERRRSRTLSPSEVKVLRSDKQHIYGGPSKIVPAMKDRESDAEEEHVTDGEYEYEDDFESYESDFEECTDSDVSEVSETSNKSGEVPEAEPIEMRTEEQKRTISSVESRKSDEERMLDSGHYELAEARRRAARIESVSSAQRETKTPTTELVVQPSLSPYREERSGENKSLPSSMDEGFEDARSGDFAKSPPLSQIAFIDFRKPAKDTKATVAEKMQPKVVSRGKKLLEMIKLDVVEWSILESKPVAYEEYIRTYGKFNTRQICVQANEDNLDVETQTETIERTNKWTQFPAKCRTVLKNDDDVKQFNMERVGVGTEVDEDSTTAKSRAIYDVLQLNEFLSQAGRVVLSLLEERAISNNGSRTDDVHEFPFSESIVRLSIDSVTFLAGRPVTMIHYSNVSNRVLLTIHAPVDEEIETSRDEDFVTDCSIGCVWNILQPSRPMKLFYSPSAITACCFHSTSYNVVLGGLDDGSISVWDLAEEETWHRKIVDDANNSEWCVRSPTYSSIGNFEDSGHNSEIVALRVLSKIEGETADGARNKFMPIQICSLDANGRLIVWSVLRNLSRSTVDDLGLSWWGDLRLVKSQEISLCSKKASERDCYLKGFSDMHVDPLDTNALYVATNATDILHANRIGKHANPPAYKSSEMDWCGDTNCIESCPFDQPYFLVGCADGTVRLHSTTAEKPLLQLKNEESQAAITTIQWSRSKPLTVYVLDVDSKIHIWDLGSSDMFPLHTISTEKWAQVNSMQLSPCRTAHEISNQYMALASDNGCVEVHRLKEGFYYAQREAIKREMNTFLRYVAIL